ncbi:MAG: hypothetical protein AB2693_30965 [Candidatus Thiodiazotropha sp.]
MKASQGGFMWATFVVPRLLYGMEALMLRKKDVDSLEGFQRQCLRQIQGLPDKTANSISLALLGILPLEAALHKNTLTTFVNMIRHKSSIENDIALRQIVMKDESDKSWFMSIRKTLKQYNLPSIFQLLNTPPSKTEWKKLLNDAVHSAIEASWKLDIKSKPSLKYVNADSLKIGKSHHVWATVRSSIHDNRRAQLKCKLLTGTYNLQGNRAAFNQHQVNATCRLCSSAPETRQHFLSECTFFHAERQAYIDKLLSSAVLQSIPASKVHNTEFLTQLTLDASAVLEMEQVDKDTWGLLELYSREYIAKIHNKRLTVLKMMSDF